MPKKTVESESQALNTTENNVEIQNNDKVDTTNSDKSATDVTNDKSSDKEIDSSDENTTNSPELTEQPPLKDHQSIIDDYQKAAQYLKTDSALFKNLYLGKALISPQLATQGVTPERLFDHGVKTGDWKAFVSTLNPVDAADFEKHKNVLIQKIQNFKKLQHEMDMVQHSQLYSKFTNDIKGKLNKTPELNEAMNFLKKVNPHFNKNLTKNVIDLIESLINKGAQRMNNDQQLKTQNEQAKANLTGAVNSSNNAASPGEKIFSRADIKKMSQAEYKQNRTKIIAQSAKGLIK